MSKKEKLAALIDAVREYANSPIIKTTAGLNIGDAYRKYESTPDDPPPKPEMPECVRELVTRLKDKVWYSQNIDAGVAAIEDYYAQPLRLEVGKVYEDGKGDRVQIVWRSNTADVGYSWLGVCGPMTGWYGVEGKSGGPSRPNLIREVPNG